MASGERTNMMISDELRELADRIDSETVELPKDKDGVPINVWDTVYDRKSGSKMEVRSMSFNGQWHLTTNKGHIVNTSLVVHDIPDSLGRIADDIEAVEERQGEDNEWRADAVFVSESTLREWADRIRKLAEKEGER